MIHFQKNGHFRTKPPLRMTHDPKKNYSFDLCVSRSSRRFSPAVSKARTMISKQRPGKKTPATISRSINIA